MEEQYWNELSSAINIYLESVGIYVELDEMSPEEIKSFFENPPDGVDLEELNSVVQATTILHGSESVGTGIHTMAIVDGPSVLAFMGFAKKAISKGKGFVDDVFDFFKRTDEQEAITGNKPFDYDSLSQADKDMYDALVEMGENPSDWGFAGEDFVIVDEAGVPKVPADEAVMGEAPEFDIDTPLKRDPVTGEVIDVARVGDDYDYVQGDKPHVEVPEGGPVPGQPVPETGQMPGMGTTAAAVIGAEATGLMPSIGESVEGALTGPYDPDDTEPDPISDSTTNIYENLFLENNDRPKAIVKDIYFGTLNEQQAFDKLTNWVNNASVETTLVADGQPLINALMQQGDVLGDMNILKTGSPQGRHVIFNYLMQNWEKIPDLKQQIEGQFSGGGATPEQAIDYYIDNMARRSSHFIVTQDNETLDGTEQIVITASFDGTPLGDVVSLNDLMSGGKLGSFNLARILDNGTTTPEQIELWQQQLFAWGYLERPPAVWGVSDQATANAINKWHVEIFNEGLVLAESGQQISPDGSPLADAVQNNAIKARLQGMRAAGTPESIMRQDITDNAFSRIQQYLTNTGRVIPEGSRHIIEKGIQKVLNDMNPSMLEGAVGQGGNQAERALAEAFFKDYYGSEDWGSYLKFGNNNNDKDYFNYALKSGALSPQEMLELEHQQINPQDYRRTHGENDFEKEKDVAVATFLGYLQQNGVPGGSLQNASIQAVASAIDTYMHTAGASRYRDNPLSSQDTLMMAARVKDKLKAMTFDNNIGVVGAATEAGIDELDLEGGVAGYQYRQLVNNLDSITPGPQGLVTRNV